MNNLALNTQLTQEQAQQDEGKVKWTDPVIQHLPEFQLYDPFVTREITIFYVIKL